MSTTLTVQLVRILRGKHTKSISIIGALKSISALQLATAFTRQTLLVYNGQALVDLILFTLVNNEGELCVRRYTQATELSVSHTGQQLTNFEICLGQFLLLKVSNQEQLFSVCTLAPGSF